MNILNYLPQLGLKPNLVNGMLFSSFASSSVSFSPASVPDLQLWLNAEQGLYQTTDTSTPAVADGDPVGRWEDQSGNARHFTQATAAKRTTLKLATLNGKPVLRFDGVDDLLAGGNLSAAFGSAATFFVVYTTTATNYAVYSTQLVAGGDPWRFSGDGKGYFAVFRSARVEGYPAIMPATGSHLVSVVSDASSYQVYLDGIGQGAQAAAYAGGTQHQIGASGDLVYQLTGDVAEVLAYSSALSDSDRQAVEEYLTTKWGIAFSPADITGLQLWLDAEQGRFTTSAGSTPAAADGDPLGRWEDQSGQGRHWTQATAAARPTLKLAIQNGLPIVRFDGVDDWLSVAAFLSGTATAELYMVARNRDAGNGGDYSKFGTEGSRVHWPLAGGDVFDSFGSTTRYNFAGAAALSWTLYTVQSAASWTAWFDTVQAHTAGGNTVAWKTGLFMLGSSVTSGDIPVNWCTLDVGELLIYSPALSSGERSLLWDYLQTRWGTP